MCVYIYIHMRNACVSTNLDFPTSFKTSIRSTPVEITICKRIIYIYSYKNPIEINSCVIYRWKYASSLMFLTKIFCVFLFYQIFQKKILFDDLKIKKYEYPTENIIIIIESQHNGGSSWITQSYKFYLLIENYDINYPEYDTQFIASLHCFHYFFQLLYC